MGTRKPSGGSSDDIKSISSGSTVSGSQSISSSSGSFSQMCFLEEIKKLAERRTDEHGLITDTLNKTKNLERIANRAVKGKSIGKEDDETRKRHGRYSCVCVIHSVYRQCLDTGIDDVWDQVG